MQPPVTTLLLDLDGTLVDTAADVMAALNTALQWHDRAPVTLAAVQAMMGDGISGLVRKALAATGGLPAQAVLERAAAQCLQIYNTQATASSVLFPGVKETLLKFRANHYQLAICTNKPEQPARHILTELGILSLLDDVVGGDTLGVCKPDPGHLLGALERLASPGATALMVGDSRNDVLAARSAGLPVIFANYGYNTLPVEQLAPDYRIDCFAEIAEILAV